jgi:mono/diheme cytochrome c family protein
VPVAAATSDDLPDGPGRRLLMGACVQCHGLREVTKFRGFYTRPQWRDIVLTMVDYGAAVGEKDVDVLTDYLTEQLGKK